MEPRRLLPFIVGLLVLAFALGSLPRSQPGGSVLFRSTWLVYLIYLVPIIILGITIAMIVIIAMNWRDITGAIGFQMARNKKSRKKGSRWSTVIAALFWILAIGVLVFKKGSILNPNPITNSTITQVQSSSSVIPIPIQIAGIIPSISNLLDNSWFGFAFLGLVILGGLVLVQSIRVAIKETKDINIQLVQGNRETGLEAVNEAIRIVNNDSSDPRSRIVSSYEHLITTASRLGAPVSSYMTARELERAIRTTFALEGSASRELTNLFEEARYSLHEILEEDANNAQTYLHSIAEELKVELQNES